MLLRVLAAGVDALAPRPQAVQVVAAALARAGGEVELVADAPGGRRGAPGSPRRPRGGARARAPALVAPVPLGPGAVAGTPCRVFGWATITNKVNRLARARGATTLQYVCVNGERTSWKCVDLGVPDVDTMK